jgi:hypothetical protein
MYSIRTNYKILCSSESSEVIIKRLKSEGAMYAPVDDADTTLVVELNTDM